MVYFFSCKKDDKSKQEMLVGKWNIESTELLGSVVPGDGSYLRFAGDGYSGTGTDFKMSDTTTGSFTYTMNDEGTSLAIVDTMAAGGNYNFTFDISALTETRFECSTNTGFFGVMKMKMKKE